MEKFGKLMAMQTYADLCSKAKNTPKMAAKHTKKIAQSPDIFVKSQGKQTFKTLIVKIFK